VEWEGDQEDGQGGDRKEGAAVAIDIEKEESVGSFPNAQYWVKAQIKKYRVD